MARSPRPRYIMASLVFTGVFMPVNRLSSQVPDSAQFCDGMIVHSVDVETNRPAFKGTMAWWRKLARAMGLHHATTATGLVRRFVSLDPGRGCTEFRRSESERILRAQPYLSDATVSTTQRGDSIHVDVSTVDEVPVVVAARLRGAQIQAATLGTMNFRGAGMHVEGRWENGIQRQGYGGKLAHSQIFGRPYSLMLDGARHPVGENYAAALSHPFITDLQRIAWHAGYFTSKDFARLRRPDRVQLLQPVDRAMWNVGGVVRLGPPRRLGLIGGMVLGERMVPRHEFLIVDSLSGRLSPTDTTGMRRYSTYDATNVAGVLGLRALTFSRMRLDALEAEQDVGTGTQVGFMLGVRPFLANAFENAFGLLDAYAAGRTPRNFVGTRVEAESRIDLQRGNWEHFVASGRASWYFRPTSRWVSELTFEAGGGWRPILPFQLELGDRNGGVRGYARSLETGGQRALVRLEQRFDVARYQKTRAAIGAAFFTDAGRMWAGDVPFGMETPTRVSVGAAVLAAVPARSQRTIRAEAAVPLSRSRGAKPELRFVVRQPARGFWYEPPRIRWARLSAVPEQIFSWP